MNVRFALVVCLGFILLGCSQANNSTGTKDEINTVMDSWHEAAAVANFDQYFGHFASNSAIFMGTDATERWTVTEFKEYAKPYFEQGEAWNFTPTQRHVYLSENGQVAWFDEVLGTPNLGPARGTGVLIHQDAGWQISHYNLSIPIPNAIADTVVQQIDRALNDSISAN